MSGFTKKEIADDLKRRERANTGLPYDDLDGSAEIQTTCAHCGAPISSVDSHEEFPLCGACDGD